MTKSRFFIVATASLLTMIAIMALPVHGERPLSDQQQTWPSRTATPEGGPPTDTPGAPPPTDEPPPPPGGDTATPVPPGQPSPTPQPGTTATATSELAPTPEGGYIPTAQPCGLPPTIQARGLVNVRQGPGLDYPTVANLVFLEVRPIIGRAEFATWWLIQLPGNQEGWVANQAVAVQGYTGNVPIVSPPPINEVTPTPGPTWEPTPNPICTPGASPTPTRTPTQPAQPSPSNISNTEPTQESPPTLTPTFTSTPEPPTDTPSPVPPSPSPKPADNSDLPTISATAEPIDDGSSGGSASSWILFAGIGLVVAGAAVFVLRQRG